MKGRRLAQQKEPAHESPGGNGAVVHTSFNKIHKIAGRNGGRITIKFKLDHPAGGRELNLGRSLKTGTTGLATARRDGSR
jgi:hypothetical protein